MDQLTPILVAIVATSIVGAVKYVFPLVKDKVPNALWPVIAFAIAKYGVDACTAVGVVCSGDPTTWGEPEAQAFAAGFIAVVTREIVKAVTPLVASLRDMVGGPPAAP